MVLVALVLLLLMLPLCVKLEDMTVLMLVMPESAWWERRPARGRYLFIRTLGFLRVGGFALDLVFVFCGLVGGCDDELLARFGCCDQGGFSQEGGAECGGKRALAGDGLIREVRGIGYNGAACGIVPVLMQYARAGAEMVVDAEVATLGGVSCSLCGTRRSCCKVCLSKLGAGRAVFLEPV